MAAGVSCYDHCAFRLYHVNAFCGIHGRSRRHPLVQGTVRGQIGPALQGTPFTVDFLAAIACQETGPIWSSLRRTPLTVDEILATCVGDYRRAGREAFPVSKAALLAERDGAEMFTIARKALDVMSGRVAGFKKSVSKPNKFCHGFGIFQYRPAVLSHGPGLLPRERYQTFRRAWKGAGELRAALKRTSWQAARR